MKRTIKRKKKQKPMMIEALFVIHAVVVVCFFVFLANLQGSSRKPSSLHWTPSHFIK